MIHKRRRQQQQQQLWSTSIGRNELLHVLVRTGQQQQQPIRFDRYHHSVSANTAAAGIRRICSYSAAAVLSSSRHRHRHPTKIDIDGHNGNDDEKTELDDDNNGKNRNHFVEEEGKDLQDDGDDGGDKSLSAAVRGGANNPGLLTSIISRGSKLLEQTAEEIRYKTRKEATLLSSSSVIVEPCRKKKKKYEKNGGANNNAELIMDPRQLAEGQRILDVATDCLDRLALRYEDRRYGGGGRSLSNSYSNHPVNVENNNNNTDDKTGLTVFGEPLILLECVVDRNLKQAKIYWTLPYGILLDKRIDQPLYQQIAMKVQNRLVQKNNGGAKLLTTQVYTKLSHYYPPRIKFFPATDEMVERAIKDIMM